MNNSRIERQRLVKKASYRRFVKLCKQEQNFTCEQCGNQFPEELLELHHTEKFNPEKPWLYLDKKKQKFYALIAMK